MMNHSIIEVAFKVHCEVLFGQELRVSGNAPALGCDDPEKAVPLITSPNEYPLWRTKEAIFLPGDAGSVSYRYCIFTGGKFSFWEDDGEVRRNLAATRSDKFSRVIEDKFGVPSMKYEEETRKLLSLSPKNAGKIAKIATTENRSFRACQFEEWSRKSMVDNNLTSQDGVIIVSYFLPVNLSRSKNGNWQANWDRENVLSLQLGMRITWIGSVRYGNAPIPLEEQDNVASVLAEFNCYPVFIDQNTHFQFYDLFCKQHLWLTMHHIGDVYSPLNQNNIGARNQQNLWFVYSEVHKLFRNKVLEVYHQKDLIWIHGFHLMLLPSFLRRRLSAAAKIGYYFHTPFPSSEIWRTMARREDLIRGILGADQIGFHLFEYARHFLTTCRRFLGCSYEMKPTGTMTVTMDGRDVAITCIHVGVDVPRVEEILRSDTYAAEMSAWRGRFPNKTIIAGIDRLERLKGVPLKLKAIDQFMEENPEWRGKLVFLLIGITAGERGVDYKLTTRDVRAYVDILNAKYSVNGDVLIHFEERSDREIRLAQRLPLFGAADILMCTATRDGLTRYPMEFTIARKKNSELPQHPEFDRARTGGCLPGEGLLILSEFISSARVMRGAVNVNPWKTSEVKNALKVCLEMHSTERADRMRRNLEFSTRLTTSNWAIHVLHDLKAVEKSADPNSAYAVGFGMHYKVMHLKTGFQQLDVKTISRSYRTARNRLILLDWGGTLVSDYSKTNTFQAYAIAKGHASREGPSTELKEILQLLCSDLKNTVFVLSGKELLAVSESFGDVRGLGLGAEHGFYYRWPRDDNLDKLYDITASSTTTTKSKWQTIMELGDHSWKDSATLIMNIFVQRTHGTYIEKKGNALIWQFRDADPEFGFLQSKELEEHLAEVMGPYPVDIIRGGGVSDGYIEVRPSGISKGLFLVHAMETLKSLNIEVDFVLAIGDDITDEPMFQQIARLKETQPDVSTFSVTVGRKPSAANFFLDDTTAVTELITSLAKSIEREKKYHSSVDLSAHVGQDMEGMKAFAKAAISSQEQISAFAQRSLSVGHFAEPVLDFYRSNSPQDRGSMGTQVSMSDYIHNLSKNNSEEDEGIFF